MTAAAVHHLTVAGEPATEIDHALCRHPAYRHDPGNPSWWEGTADGETRRERDRRQAIGIRLCRQCPMLEPCRRLLADLDARQLPIDGVVAGRIRRWRIRERHRTRDP